MPQETTTGISQQADGPSKLTPFIAYSKLDKDAARDFVAKLKSRGWIDPWIDVEDILPGQVWQAAVATGVRNSHAVIILLSKAALASEGYFQNEIRLALDTVAEKPEGTIFIIPIRLDECEVPEMLKKYQYVDYFGEARQKESVFSSLIAALRVRAEHLDIKT